MYLFYFLSNRNFFPSFLSPFLSLCLSCSLPGPPATHFPFRPNPSLYSLPIFFPAHSSFYLPFRPSLAQPASPSFLFSLSPSHRRAGPTRHHLPSAGCNVPEPPPRALGAEAEGGPASPRVSSYPSRPGPSHPTAFSSPRAAYPRASAAAEPRRIPPPIRHLELVPRMQAPPHASR